MSGVYYSGKERIVTIIKYLSVGIMMIMIIVIVWLLMHGERRILGSFSEPMASSYLTCETETLDYPFFTYDRSERKVGKINVLFSNDVLDSISFVYMLYYDDIESAKSSEAINHAAMNMSFANYGLDADSLNIDYTVLNDGMKMSLYAGKSDIKDSGVFFLLDSVIDDNYTLDIVRKNYEGQNFLCKSDSE